MPTSNASVRAKRWPEILRLMRSGKNSTAIANELGLSVDLVKNYVHKLQVSADPDAYVAERVATLTPQTQLVPVHVAADRTDEDRVAEQATRDEIAAQARHYKSLLSQQAFEDKLLTQVVAAAKSVPVVRIPVPKPVKSESQAQVALLVASDWHVGAIVSAEETGGIGHYDLDTFTKRLELLGDKVASITADHASRRPITKLVLVLGGDLVDGQAIFEAQEVEIDVLQQVFFGANKLVELILKLLHSFETIEVIALPGNHSRLGRKGQYKVSVSFDRQMAKFAEMAMTGYQDRVTWEIPEAPFFDFEIEGHAFHAEHGDTVKSWMNLPAYGLERAAGRLSQIAMARGAKFQHSIAGHFHSSAMIERPGGAIHLNGSLMGPTEFSTHQLKTLSRPSQTLMFIHKQYGITATYVIWLDDV